MDPVHADDLNSVFIIQSERTGDWDLHLATFKDMLSWMMIYDHTNYSRWGVVYLLDVLQLPESCPDVWNEFKAGNFVVKESQGSFNQISPDLALEHINKQCRIAGGLVGITKTQSALNRWMITFSYRVRLENDAKKSVGMSTGRSLSHGDLGSHRIKSDQNDVARLHDQIKQCNPFGPECEDLVCISTNDVTPDDIKDLLSASTHGKEKLQTIVQQRLSPNASKSLYDMIPKTNQRHLPQ